MIHHPQCDYPKQTCWCVTDIHGNTRLIKPPNIGGGESQKRIDRCHEEVSRRHELQPCDLAAVAMRLDPEGGRPYPVCARHTRRPMVPLAMLLSQIADKGRAVVESGLSVRQAHEIETGCTTEQPCAHCKRYQPPWSPVAGEHQ